VQPPETGAISPAVLGHCSPRQSGPLVALMPQWRQEYLNNRPPTRATAMSEMGLVSRVTPVHTAMRNCTGDEGRPFLRQDKSRKGERECDLKPFIAIQRVQLPPGKGEPASRKRALRG
jgi:hypothetical protein